MRKLLLLITLCCTLGTVAQRVTEEQALQKARNFLKDKTFSKANKARSIKGKSQNNPFKNFYIFNVEDDAGFVIVSGDERTKDILGYSDRGHLDYAEMPCNLKYWLSYYEEAIGAIPSRTTTTSTVTRAPKAGIPPLMNFSWHQYDPYNYYCPASPEDPNAKSVTGCVATAMAQLMYYYKYPSALPALDAYTYNGTIQVPALEGKPMDWSNDDDIRWLSRYCGQSVQMAYDKGGSSAMEALVPVAMVKKFQYDGAEHAVSRDAYNAETWENMIYNELAQGRPVIYAGHDLQTAPGVDYGHVFIVDGYDGNGFYHVNWGWDVGNDYFALDVMNAPDGCTYSSNQLAVIGIQPDKGGTADYPSFSCTKMEVTSDLEVSRASAEESFKNVTVSWKTPAQVLEPGQYDLCIYISDDSDGGVLLRYNTSNIEPGWTYNHDITFDGVRLNIFPKATDGTTDLLSDGTYKLSMRYKTLSENEWHKTEGSDYRYIQMTKSGNKLVFKNYPSSEPDEPEIPQAVNYVVNSYPANKVKYDNKQLSLETTWAAFTRYVLNEINANMTSFDERYKADCLEGGNGHQLKLFNFGTDIYGNGGTPPSTGYAQAETPSLGTATYYPNGEGTTNNAFSWTLTKDEIDKLIKDQKSPVTVNRWICFAAKNANAAPYPYIWIKMTMEISFEDTSIKEKYYFSEKVSNYWYHLNPTGSLSDSEVSNGWSAIVLDVEAPRDAQTIKNQRWISRISNTLVGNYVNIEGKSKYYFAPKGGIQITAQNGMIYSITPQNENNLKTYNKLFTTSGEQFTWDETTLEETLNNHTIIYGGEGAGVFNNNILYAMDYKGTYTPIVRLTQEQDKNDRSTWDQAGTLELIHTLPDGSANTVLYDILNAIGVSNTANYSKANINKQLRAWLGYVKNDGNNVAQYVEQGKYDDNNKATFLVSWERPVNTYDVYETEKINTEEKYLYLLDYLRLFDWRGDKPKQGYMWDDHYWFWAYYNVKEIEVDLNPQHVLTNLHKDGLTFTPLRNVTTPIQFSPIQILNANTSKAQVAPATGNTGKYTFDLSDDRLNFTHVVNNNALKAYMGVDPDIPVNKARFGGIYYKSNGEDDVDFCIDVPITIKYEWGNLMTTWRINIANTPLNEGNTFTRDGIKYTVINTNPREVEVGTGWHEPNHTAIDSSTQGVLDIPTSVKGNDGITYDVTQIGSFAFCQCTGLTKITIPNTVRHIGFYAFLGCTGLTSMTIPKSVETIDYSAFESCEGLTSFDVDWQTPPAIDESVFTKVDLSQVTLYVPAGTKGTYETADVWKNFTNIVEKEGETITFTTSKGLTFKGYTATQKATLIAVNSELTGEVRVPEVVLKDGKPFTVVAIGTKAFDGCVKIEKVELPKSIEDFTPGALSGCTALKEIAVIEGGGRFCAIDGVLYSIGKDVLVAYPAAKNREYEIPATVSSILDGAFAHAQLDILTLGWNDPYAVTVDKAFEGIDFENCKLSVPLGTAAVYRSHKVWGLFKTIIGEETVAIEGNTYKVREDGSVVFAGPEDKDIEGDYVIPSTVIINGVETPVTEIGDRAFEGCKGLTSVTIPKSVEHIGEGAFSGCDNLEEIICESEKPVDLGHNFVRTRLGLAITQFEGINFDTCILYVPVGSKTAYENAEGWNQFKHIVEYDPSAIRDVRQNEAESEVYYNLQGQRVENPTNGLYIKNGRKVIVKPIY